MWLAKYKVGSRIVTTVDIEIIPWDDEDGVAAGDHGEVIDVDPETGDLTVLMDRLIPALVGRRNYLFLRANRLSEIRSEIPQSSLRRVSAFLSAAAAALVMTFVFTVGATATYHHVRPSLEIREAIVDSPLVSQGGVLIISSYAHRVRECPSTISRVIRDNSDTVVWRDTIVVASNTYDWGWKSFYIKLPDYLTPGTYSFVGEIVTQCDGWTGTEIAYNPPAGQHLLKFQIASH